jgi:hypothetical protein
MLTNRKRMCEGEDMDVDVDVWDVWDVWDVEAVMWGMASSRVTDIIPSLVAVIPPTYV